MNSLSVSIFLFVSVLDLNPQSEPPAPQDESVILAAAARDSSMLSGGIGSGKWSGRGTLFIEPLARLTPSGDWLSLPCSPREQKTCAKFAREYLSKSHTYTVVSAGGEGASVHAEPTKLSECFGFVGIGSYADGQIAGSAITASSAELFATIPTPRLLGNSEAEPIRKALVALTPRRLDSTRHLRILSVQLEGQDLIVLQRAFAEADYTSKAAKERLKYIFAIGIAARDGVHILHWKKNTDDECESVLGTIRLKSGRDFLVTSVSDPESQSFRVYGIRDGHLALVYSGGGWSC